MERGIEKMIYGFYFRFLKMTHNKWISIILSKLAYLLYLIKFQYHRLTRKREFSGMSVQEAESILKEIRPDPNGRPQYKNPQRDSNIDLSIIVPVYNYENLIRDNIESILAQKTAYTYELILVDDGSTDGAREILLSYQNNPKVHVVLRENGGIAAARNSGLENASGKYVMFIDCDDTIHDDMVEVLMRCAYQNNSDIAMCAHNLSKERNGEIYQVIPNIYPQSNLMNYKNGDEIMNYAGLPWCKVYRRELWDQVRFFPGYWYEDTIIQFLLFTQCKRFDYIPKVEYEYRWYENNFSHTQGNAVNPKCTDCYWLLLAIINHYKEMGLPFDNTFYTLLLRHISVYYYSTISKLGEEKLEAMFVMAREMYKKYRPSSQCPLPYMLRIIEKAFDRGDISLWRLASMYV